MKTIHKFALNALNQVIHMPVGYKILTVAYQGSELQMWVELDSSLLVRPIPCAVSIYGTGCSLPEDPGTYIATVQTVAGYVWHIYYNEL